jgi:hypothetical protein
MKTTNYKTHCTTRTSLQKVLGNAISLAFTMEAQKTITVHKGTAMLVLPSTIHTDDRFWDHPRSFRPHRWDAEPALLADDGFRVQTRRGGKHRSTERSCEETAPIRKLDRSSSSEGMRAKISGELPKKRPLMN